MEITLSTASSMQAATPWVLNEDTCLWDAPVPMPQDGQMYSWDEATTSWVTEQAQSVGNLKRKFN